MTTETSNARGEVGTPTWRKQKPTRAGVYGVRGFNFGVPASEQFEAIVAVRLYNDELICNLHISTSEDDFDDWSLVEECNDKFEWCEFAAAPPPAAAVLTNPHTGEPRDYRDVNSDPEGTLIVAPGEPLRPAAARGDVRGLVESLRFAASRWKRESDYHASGIADDYGSGQRHAFLSCANEMLSIIEQALAAEGVQAGEVEQRDREADRARFTDPDFNDWLDCGISDCGHTVYDSIGSVADAWQGWHAHVVSVMLDSEPEASADLDAILSQQPEARGVVDEDEVFRLAAGSHYGAEPNSYWDMDRDALLAFARALTGERNG